MTVQKIKSEWQRSMLVQRDDIVALDSCVILNPDVWVASGHVGGFTDPMRDCRTCKRRFRSDHLDSAPCGLRPSKMAGHSPNCDLTDARDFNLMFETFVGPVREQASRAFLRPETAQGIFINFKNITSSMRIAPPFGIAQIGKSFRNEITPGNFLFRVREFEQMEMEFFVPPEEAADWHTYWVQERLQWHLRLGLRACNLRIRPHEADELSHYSSATSDIEYQYPIGWQELEGVANRGDYDLRQHAAASGVKLEWVGQDIRYVPHIVEPALGVGRSFLAFMVDAYEEEEVNGRLRTVLHLHPRLAPVKVAVLPLIGRDSAMVEVSEQLYRQLREFMAAEHDTSAAIGKRYRRQDEIGTPWAITVDEQTLLDGTVTIRDRDTLLQERIPRERVAVMLLERLAEDWRAPSERPH
jgi:glycyl-tRNA synthetase